MTSSLEQELGVEYYDEMDEAPKQEDRGFLKKAAEAGAFGILGIEEGRRHVGRTVARAGEAIAGLPGDIVELFNSIAIGIPEYFAGEELPTWRRMVEGDPTVAGLNLPTSSQLRELTQAATGEFLEPQTKWEEFGDAVTEDFAVLALPVKGKVPFARALGTSVLANSGAEIANAFGGEGYAGATKMGLLIASGFIGKGGLRQHIRNLYNDMETAIPQGAEVSATNLSKRLNEIEAIIRKGDPLDASKAPVFQKINAIRDKIQGGMIPVDEVVELTKSTNESIFGLGELKRSQNQLYNVRNALHETTKEYGAQNKAFLDKWKAANQAYAATETSRRIGNWVRKNVKPKDYIYAGSALGGGSALLGTTATGTALAGAGGVAATAYTAEVLKRIAQSPELKKYYMDATKAALKENSAAFAKSMRRLDNGLKRSFDEDPYETIEFE